jgi:hypothetical protein
VFTGESTLAPLYDSSQTGEASQSDRLYLNDIEFDGDGLNNNAELRLKAIATGSPLARPPATATATSCRSTLVSKRFREGRPCRLSWTAMHWS